MTTTERKTGRCLCGAVTVTAALKAMDVCHCAMCRRQTSGPIFALEIDGAIETTGEDAVRVYNSSEWAERAFCGACGTALWYKLTAPGPAQGYTMLFAGLFDDFAGLPLSKEICIDSKPACYALDGERPRLTAEQTLAMFTEGSA